MANTTGEADSKIRSGFDVGLDGDVMLTGRFGIETGVYYSTQGSKYNGNEVPHMDKLDYINTPVHAKEFIYKGPYLFGGLQLSFSMNFESKASSDHTTIVAGANVIRTFDCGVGLDARYQSERGLLVSLNYNIGLTNVSKAWANNSNPKASSSVVRFNIGWRFAL